MYILKKRNKTIKKFRLRFFMAFWLVYNGLMIKDDGEYKLLDDYKVYKDGERIL